MFATKPQLAGALLDRAHRLGIRAAFVAGDEVYGMNVNIWDVSDVIQALVRTQVTSP